MRTDFLQALSCTNLGRPPVWFMRQAGRYMSSYRKLREKHSFLTLCHHPELIAEVTLLPIDAFGFDAAIIFSDILVIPEAMNLGLRFEDSVGPIIERPITNLNDINEIPSFNADSLKYVSEGIKLVKPRLKVPLIGFCGAPFTVASYMIEGKSSRDLKKTKKWLLSDPKTFHLLLEKITDWSISYLKTQIEAGVDAIQLFDSWAVMLAHHQFREFSLEYLKKIIAALKPYNIPVIIFCKGSSLFGSHLLEAKPQAISFDHNCHLPNMRSCIPYPCALQGNLDPDVLYAPPPKIHQEVHQLLEGMRGDKGFIFNLGHGIHPDIPEDHVRLVVETVKSFS